MKFILGFSIGILLLTVYLSVVKYQYHKDLANSHEMLLCYYAGNPHGINSYPCVRVKRGTGW